MAGTITVVENRDQPVKTIVATCTADASDGSFPAHRLPPFSGRLLSLRTNPGSTAPTDNYDITLVDQDGLDRLAGLAINRDTTNSEAIDLAGIPVSVLDELDLTITGNSVHSATTVITITWAETAGGGGSSSGSTTVDTSALATSANQTAQTTLFGAVTETAPASDTASSGLNGRLQRIAQRITSLIALLPTALAGNGGLKVELASGLDPTNDAITIGTRAGVGATPFQNLDVDESEDDISTSACTLYTLIITNVATGVRYVKLYNATAANTTVGSTTPVQTYAIPAGGGLVLSNPAGVAFSTALCIAATTGVAVADTGAPGTNDVIVSGSYK